MEQERDKEQPVNTAGITGNASAKKRKRLPSQGRLRRELVYQLRESLLISQEKMKNPESTTAEQEHWTRVHTYTAQVLNTILRDQQFREWEKRLKELERQGLIPNIVPNSEP